MAEPSQSSPTPIAEIDHGPSKFDQFMEDHQKKLIIAAILIALGVIGYVVWSGIQEGKQHEAGAALVKADEPADYRDVISKHADTNAAASAMPLLAIAEWPESQPDSISTLQDFIASHPEHPAILTAKTSLGLRLLDQGKLEEAREALTEIAESHPDSYIAPLAFIALGDIAKTEGNTTDAKDWYEKAKGEGIQASAFQGLATQRLALASAKPPVKIKPAPPAPPAPPAAPALPAIPKTPDGDLTPPAPLALPTPPAAPTDPAETPEKPSTEQKKETTPTEDKTKLPAPNLTPPDTPKKEAPAKPGNDNQDKPEPTL